MGFLLRRRQTRFSKKETNRRKRGPSDPLAARADLGHAVRDKELAAKQRQRAPRHGVGQRRPAARQHPHRAQVASGRAGAAHEQGDHRGGQVADAHALALDRREHARAVECRQQHVPPAHRGHGVDGERVDQVKHGRKVAPHVVRLQPHLGHARRRVLRYDALAQHHRLGRAGGAGREVHLERIVPMTPRPTLCWRLRRTGQQGFIVHGSRGNRRSIPQDHTHPTIERLQNLQNHRRHVSSGNRRGLRLWVWVYRSR